MESSTRRTAQVTAGRQNSVQLQARKVKKVRKECWRGIDDNSLWIAAQDECIGLKVVHVLSEPAAGAVALEIYKLFPGTVLVLILPKASDLRGHDYVRGGHIAIDLIRYLRIVLGAILPERGQQCSVRKENHQDGHVRRQPRANRLRADPIGEWQKKRPHEQIEPAGSTATWYKNLSRIRRASHRKGVIADTERTRLFFCSG